MAERLVVDASVLVDLLLGNEYGDAALHRLSGALWYAPAHVDTEVFSVLGRHCRAGAISEWGMERRLAILTSVPLRRQPLPPLLLGAWSRHAQLRLVDALYVELAAQLEIPLVTTDQRLARATPLAEAITP